MSLFIAIASHRAGEQGDRPIVDRAAAWLEARCANVHRASVDARWTVLCADLGAYPWPSQVIDDEGAVLALAGDPVLPCADGARTNMDAAQVLSSLRTSVPGTLSRARGSFACLLAEPERLVAATDKLGIRGAYWYSDARCRFVTSSQRLAWHLLDASAVLDFDESLTRACLGFGLGDRTPLRGLHAIAPGHYLEWQHDSAPRVVPYWQWPTTSPGSANPSTSEFDAVFTDAVARRCMEQAPREYAFLSGGLDSRAIVAALRSSGVGRAVATVGYGAPGTANNRYSAAAAARLGTHHVLVAIRGTPNSNSKHCVELLTAEFPEAHRSLRRMWSGDGGSVLLGHVYLPCDDRVGWTMERLLDETITKNHWLVPTGLLTQEYAARLREGLHSTLSDVVAHIDEPEPMRRLHRFIVATDQRWHLTAHHETILEQGFEFVLPFFDSEVVAWIFRHSAVPFLAHRFYNAWAMSNDWGIADVPWQHYPGHVPSPVPVDPDVVLQWDQARTDTRKDLLASATVAWNARRRPETSTPRIVAAWLAALAGVPRLHYASRQLELALAPLAAYERRTSP